MAAGSEFISQADLDGRVWVVQVWSSWCRPCVEELDALPELYARLRADGLDFEFLSISTDDERESCEHALEGRDLGWVLAWTGQPEELMKAWGFAGVPLTLVVDAGGTVVGLWDQSTSMAAIEKVVRETAAGTARPAR